MDFSTTILLGLSSADLLGFIFVIGAVLGIRLMGSPTTARGGNLIGAISMTGAIIVTLISEGIISLGILWFAIAVGSALGYYLAIKVAMLQMPQMVALLNGFGGGSSAIVALLTLLGPAVIGPFEQVTAILGLLVGAVTLTGSLIAAGKLAGKINQRPIIFEGQAFVNNVALILSVVSGLVAILYSGRMIGTSATIIAFAIALAYGILFTIRVGGADMPITVSLLNSFSGVAASISGLAIKNPLLVAIGAIVGASGLILTQIMCKAMNRSLAQVLMGKTTVLQTVKGKAKSAADSVKVAESEFELSLDESLSLSYVELAKEARKVIIVPGYGMALAQAQRDVKTLMDKLEANGAEVKVAIHPVAGRMPGHMNVLLAEADVSYDKLYEMDQINNEFADTDLVIVVGANDVINPAANTEEGTPIYGMPILNVNEAKHVLIFNYDTKPGYAGVENPLYEADNATLLLGDAADTIKSFIEKFNDTSVAIPIKPRASHYVDVAKTAKHVIIVPGYGMALAQAQRDVKSLMDKLEANGAEVKVAIHPVAGRMPGHMNVLLAEADVSYDKLHEMDQINDEFADTDLVIVVGANDVINHAANTAEETPIYGMPILNVHEAKHVLVFNYDTKPGYAGVDNPLYKADNVTLLLGDAAATLKEFTGELGL